MMSSKLQEDPLTRIAMSPLYAGGGWTKLPLVRNANSLIVVLGNWSALRWASVSSAVKMIP